MSGYGFQDALSALKDVKTLEQIYEVVNNTSSVLDAYPQKYTSVLYSGNIDDIQTHEIVEGLVKNTKNEIGPNRIVRVDDTPVGELMFSRELKHKVNELIPEYLERTIPNYANLPASEQRHLHLQATYRIFNNKDISGTRLPYDPQKLSLWDIASRNFVRDAPGDFRIVANGALETSVFLQTEFPELLSKKGSFLIEGTSIDDLAKLGDETAIKNFILERSRMNIHFSGLSLSSVDDFINWSNQHLARAMADPTKMDAWNAMRQANLDNEIKTLSDIDRSLANAAKSGGSVHIGMLGALIGVSLVALEAAVIYRESERLRVSEGDARADKHIADSAVGLAAGIAVGNAVAAFGFGILAGLALANPVGLAVGVVFVLGTSIAAGLATEHVVSKVLDADNGEIPQVTVKDGVQTISYSSGFQYSEAISGNKTGFDKSWVVPDANGTTLKIDHNSQTGQQVRSVYAGNELTQQTSTTPDGEGVIKVESLTRNVENGSTVESVERVTTSDGSVLNSWKKTTTGNGLVTVEANDGQNNTSITTFDHAGDLNHEKWTKADGSHGETTYGKDGARDAIINNADGSSLKYSKDSAGSERTTVYDPSGTRTGESWKSFDGSSGAVEYRADGSVASERRDRDGTVERQFDDGRGNVDIAIFDANNRQTSSRWERADGSYGESKLNEDGTTTAITKDAEGNLHTTVLNENKEAIGRDVKWADGKRLVEVIHPDKSREGKITSVDGSYINYTDDGNGNSHNISYSIGGWKTGEAWKNSDGSRGVESYKFDGSKVGEFTRPDGSFERYSDDGKGNIVSKTFDADKKQTGSQWAQADGSKGSEKINPVDGSKVGIVTAPDGNYVRYESSTDGNGISISYAKDGSFVAKHWKNADGTQGGKYTDKDGSQVEYLKDSWGTESQTRYGLDGVVRSNTINPDKSGTRTLDDGQGVRIETTYAADGHTVESNKTIRYNADGSGTVEISDANGRVSEQKFGKGELGPLTPKKEAKDAEPPKDGKIILPSPNDPSTGSGDPQDNDPELDPDTVDGETPEDTTPEFSEGEWEKVQGADRLGDSENTGRGTDVEKSRTDALRERLRQIENEFRRTPTVDPLALDLDGNGLQTLPLSAGVFFDHDGNRVQEATGWVGPADGLLAWDRDGNGLIDSGRELFGNFTRLVDGKNAAHGFMALQEMDSNQDGQINAQDANFAQLRVWKDANSNGVSEAGELLSLQASGVASIATAFEESQKVDGQDNQHRQIGLFQRTDGSWGQVNDVWFARDLASTRSDPAQEAAHQQAFADLPDVNGFGGVRSLREAMAEDASLEQAVRAYMNAPAASRSKAMLNTIVQKWTGADKVDIPMNAGNLDKHQLFALDIVSGIEPYDRSSVWPPAAVTRAARMIPAAYDFLLESVHAALLEPQVQALHQALQFSIGADGSIAWTLPLYENKKKTDPQAALADLARLYREHGPALLARGVDLGGKLRQEVAQYAQQPEMQQTIADLQIVVGSGELGGPGSYSPMSVFGGAGNDTLQGGFARDIFDGGAGNDTIYAGLEDTVVFGLESAHDVLQSGQNAHLVMGKGVRPDEVSLSLQKNPSGEADLILTLKSGATLKVRDWYFSQEFERLATPEATRLGRISFADGTEWRVEDLYARLPALGDGNDERRGIYTNDLLHAGSGQDVLNGGRGSDVLQGGTGNDSVNGQAGSDLILGGAGDDELSDFGSGSDLLDGGSGNDVMRGYEGSDTYFFDRGYGQDQLIEYESLQPESNVLIFGPGIASGDLFVTRLGEDLLFRLKDSHDQLQILDWFNQKNSQVKYFLFNDGTRWGVDEAMANISWQAGAGSDALNGTPLAEQFHGQDGNDTIKGFAGADTLDGGNGADNLWGGGGDDLMQGGAENDWLYAENGDDTLRGGAGDDELGGGQGNDTFIFAAGDGRDVISDIGVEDRAGEVSVIRLEYLARDVEVVVGGYEQGSVILRRTGSEDSVELASWLRRATPSPVRVEFADGEVWDSQILASKIKMLATPGHDFLYGNSTAEVMLGEDGNDNIAAGAGNDTIDGGSGNDLLDGGSGSDTYLFGYGSGQDRIYENDASEYAAASIDTIRLAAGIRPEDVSIEEVNFYLNVLKLAGSPDQLEFARGDEAARVERLEFADGTVWDLMRNQQTIQGVAASQVNSRTQRDPSTGAITIVREVETFTSFVGSRLNDAIQGSQGVDSLYGGEGNDSLYGGAGNDTLSGGTGVDLLDGGAGDDKVYADRADRILFGFGSGSDQLYRPYDARATLVFKEGVRPEDVQLKAGAERSLLLNLAGAADSLKIAYWFNTENSENTVNRFEFADGTVWNVADILSRVMAPVAGEDNFVHGSDAHDQIQGQDGNDVLSGLFGNDSIDGAAGNDSLSGGVGDDVLIGGVGNDTLDGAMGNDSYLFERGFGQDVIADFNGNLGDSQNRIVFGQGIAPSDIIVTGDNQFTQGANNNLYLTLFGSQDKITIRSWFDAARSNIESVEFADGTKWDKAELRRRYFALERGGWMDGSELPDNLLGDGSDDRISGMDGNDTLDGSGGDDELLGHAGDDVLVGGVGNDVLLGGIGDDTYRFEAGFGKDAIADFDRANFSHDRIVFGAGITPEQIRISRNAAEIVLAIADSKDVLSIRWYDNPGLPIEQIEFANGVTWSAAQLQAWADATWTREGSDGDDILQGDAKANILRAAAGDDKLIGESGHDSLYAGMGNDHLLGGAGSDVMYGDAGDDVLDGGSGGDLLVGGDGNDSYLLDNPEDSVVELSGQGLDSVQADFDYQLPDAVENLRLLGERNLIARGNALDNVLQANQGGNQLYAGLGNDSLYGGAGMDALFGEDGADTLQGGAGNDRLHGAAGNDLYLYARGDGNDTIADFDTATENLDILRFAADIKPEDVEVSMDFDLQGSEAATSDLHLHIKDSEQRITLRDWLYGSANRIERIEFADGSNWDSQQLLARLYGGSEASEQIRGRRFNDALYGLGGDDSIFGGDGHDTLHGGSGNDWLDGGNGSDTYLFQRGDGIERIAEAGDYSAEDQDTLQFAADILPTNVKVVREGDDLALQIDQDAGQVIIEKWFTNGQGNIAQVVFADGTRWSQQELRKMTGGGLQVISGSAQSDALDGSAEDDHLLGLAGDDQLSGGEGNDILQGGQGVDVLFGGAGDDTYVFERGDGEDWVNEYDPHAGTNDVLRLGAGILPSEVSLSRDISGLSLSIAGSNDRINLNNWFAEDQAYKLEWIEFADGTRWDMAEVLAALPGPSEGDDSLVSQAEGSRIVALGGDDRLFGLQGNDSLEGGQGNDYIVAGDGQDVLEGGSGIDVLEGGFGQDTYVFQPGFGRDFLVDAADTAEQPDLIRLQGVTPDKVSVARDRNNLFLLINASSDQISLANWFLEEATQRKQVIFDDGTVWQTQDLLARLNLRRSSEFDDVLYGEDADDSMYALGGSDLLESGAGNDFLDGGADDDTLLPGADNDLAFGGAGMDSLTDEEGVNLLEGGSGDDYLYANSSFLAGGVGKDELYLNDGKGLIGFNAGDGEDKVYLGQGRTVLSLGFAIEQLSLQADANSQDLILNLGQDKLRLADWYATQGNGANPEEGNRPETESALVLQLIQNGVASRYDLRQVIADFERATVEMPKGSLWSAKEALLAHEQTDDSQAALGGDIAFAYAQLGSSARLSKDLLQQLLADPELLHTARRLSMPLPGIEVPTPGLQLTGSTRADNLQGAAGHDLLQALAGNDKLFGGQGNDTLDGGSGADLMQGGAGDDIYVQDHASDVLTELADEGHDTLHSHVSTSLPAYVEDVLLLNKAHLQATGNALNNRMQGNLGNNLLDGAAGADTMLGGAGNDTYVVDDSQDSVQEEANQGTDTVKTNVAWALGANLENLSLLGDADINGTGNELPNQLLGNAGRNQLIGEAGNDVLNGGAGADTLLGGLGNDSYVVDDADDVVQELEAEGNDLVKASFSYTLGAHLENLTLTGEAALDATGNELNNVLTGNAAANRLVGGEGNDKLIGGAGMDQLIGGVGNDVYVVDELADDIVELANEGTDTIQTSLSWTLAENLENLSLTGNADLHGIGNAANNSLSGNSGANLLQGGAGNDVLKGGGGADSLEGGSGNDTYVVESSGDLVIELANEGVDLVQTSIDYTLPSHVEKLTLTGQAELAGSGNALDNVLTGNAAANRLFGGDGNDSLNGGAALDYLAGGMGNDVYTVEQENEVVLEAEGEGVDVVNASSNFVLPAHVENLLLSGNNPLQGAGNALDNLLQGNAASNYLLGAAGNDTLNGGAGVDRLEGSSGDDVYILDNPQDTVLELENEGIDQVRSTVSHTLAEQVEALFLSGSAALQGQGNALHNLLQGNGGANLLDGLGGNDVLQGMAGVDRLQDVIGNNLFDAGAGHDVILAGAGNDVIAGGAGNDNLSSGGGADIILFNRGDGQDVLNPGDGQDDTLSLGRGIRYADLLFKKSGNDLLLLTGNNEQIKLKDWYVEPANHSVANLQIVVEASADYQPDAANPSQAGKLARYDFAGLVSEFDQARVQKPSLSSWALSNALLNFHLGSSNEVALGGDLAYQYGKQGQFTNMAWSTAQHNLDNLQAGSMQSLQTEQTGSATGLKLI